MIPVLFDYVAPTTIDEAVALLSEHGDRAKLLAGGQSLIPMMKLRLAAPELLIDLTRLSGLGEIRYEDGVLRIGALCTYAQIARSPVVREFAPVLAVAASQVGDQQVRNLGTIGGSLAHADPAADLPAVVLALDAAFVMRGSAGERVISATDFFVAMMTTALEPDEILVEVRVRTLSRDTGSSFLKFPNPASGYALVGVAAVVRREGNLCTDARVGVTGAGPVPTRATHVESRLIGLSLDEHVIGAAAAAMPEGMEILGDLHASEEYRAHLLRVFSRKAIEAAARPDQFLR